MMLGNILLVGLGGGLGSIARYSCQRWIGTLHTHHFPWGTFAVNITGCFLIGLFWGITARQSPDGSFTPNSQLFLMTGICGGFTTFSAFTLEGIGLLRDQKLFLFFLYTGASLLLGLLATWGGIRLMR